MGRFFPPYYGDIEVTVFYADNKPYCREVRFSIPNDRWIEFETSQTYRQLVDYVRTLQTQRTQTQHHEVEPGAESERLLHHSMRSDRRESFLARVRNRFRKTRFYK